MKIKKTLAGTRYITIGDEHSAYELLDNQDAGNPNLHYFELRPEDNPKAALLEFALDLHNPGASPEEAIAEGLVWAKAELQKKMHEDEELFGRLLELVKLELNKIYGAGGVCA